MFAPKELRALVRRTLSSGALPPIHHHHHCLAAALGQRLLIAATNANGLVRPRRLTGGRHWSARGLHRAANEVAHHLRAFRVRLCDFRVSSAWGLECATLSIGDFY